MAVVVGGTLDEGHAIMKSRQRHSIGEPLIKFWSELSEGEPYIHPRDEQVVRRFSDCLKTEYPPPAFIGDVRGARVFLLWGNGGFHPQRTIQEFAAPGSAEKFLRRLRKPEPWATLKFQEQQRVKKWLEAGDAVVVNAMAYRSTEINRNVREIADELPSVHVHRCWLRRDLIPACGRGEVMVVAHRPGLWGLSVGFDQNKFLLFTENPKAKYLPKWVCDRVELFLAR